MSQIFIYELRDLESGMWYLEVEPRTSQGPGQFIRSEGVEYEKDLDDLSLDDLLERAGARSGDRLQTIVPRVERGWQYKAVPVDKLAQCYKRLKMSA